MIVGLRKFISKNQRILLFFAGILLILILNSLHATYPDEFDNILGGKLITRGIFPYSGFFSHHGVVAYLVAALIVPFSGVSFVHFRLLSAVFYLVVFLSGYLAIARQVRKRGAAGLFAVFILAVAISATYFWGNMLLADPLSVYFLVPAYALLLMKIFYRESLERNDLVVVSAFSALTVLNSPTYLYATAVIVAITSLYYFFTDGRIDLTDIRRKFLNFVVIFALPYLLFLIYLLATGALKDFSFDVVTYNRNYYIYNYPRPAGSTSFNPIRYAVVILNDFVNSYQTAITSIKNIDLRYPLTGAFALANGVLMIYLFLRRKFLAGLLVFSTLVYASARGNPSDIRPIDYQSAGYFVLTLFNTVLTFRLLFADLPTIKEIFTRNLLLFLGILTATLWFFSGIFLGAEFWRMNYSRYMGALPLIYDRPVVAPIVNSVVGKDEYCWVGPFEFEEMFYLRCRLPAKYHWILPQLAGLPEIRNKMIEQYSKNMAEIIVFRRNYFVFGAGPEYLQFFDDFLDQNYVRFKDLPKFEGYHFVSKNANDFVLDDDFNFRKDKAESLVGRLIQLGYVQKT